MMNRKIPRLLITLATIMAPFTLLRFSFFGTAELLFALLFLLYIFKAKNLSSRHFPLSIFWTVYICACLIGSLVNDLMLSHSTGTNAGMLYDLSSYVFVFMTCFTLESLLSQKRLDPRQLMRDIFYGFSLVMTALYVISRFTPTFFGIPLFYYDHFVPLTANLHQVAMFLVPMPFLGLVVMAQEKRFQHKVMALALVFMDVFMAYGTGSTKAPLAIVVGAAVFIYASSLKLFGRNLAISIKLLYSVGIITMVNYYDLVYDLVHVAERLFVEYDGAGARMFIYQKAVQVGLESFLFGHGPGPHVAYGEYSYWDAHQTLLTVFLQAGLLGLLAITVLAYRIARRAVITPGLLAALFAISIYALGGDILRRLPIWIVLFTIAHYPVSPVRESAGLWATGTRKASMHSRASGSGAGSGLSIKNPAI